MQQTKLKKVLNSLIDFCFNGGEKNHIGVSIYGAKWVNDPSKYIISFDKQRIKDGVAFLLDNCYFIVGNKLFKQIIYKPYVF